MSSNKGSIAVTRRINGPGLTPLSIEQVWKGLQEKSRRPMRFIKIFTGSTITNDKGSTFTRAVTTPGPTVVEDIYEYGPTVIYFDGVGEGTTRVTNVVSYGEEGELLLTFSFVQGVPGVSDEQLADRVAVSKRVGNAVEETIAEIRKMAEVGEI